MYYSKGYYYDNETGLYYFERTYYSPEWGRFVNPARQQGNPYVYSNNCPVEMPEELEEFDNPFRYAGYYYDESSGYYYLQSRYYNPEIMRFISEDTYRGNPEDPLSLNYYTYCQGNPLIYHDPDGYSAKEVLFTFLGALNSGGKKVVAGVTYVGERAVAAVHATGELAVDVGKGAYQFGRELGDYMYTGDATILKQMPGNMVEGIKDNFKTTFNMENFKNYLDPNTSYTELKDYSKSTIQTGLTIYGGAKIVQSTINLGTNLYHGVQVNKFIHKNVPYAQQPDVKAAFGSNAKVTTLKHNTNVYRYHGGTSASKSNWVTPNQTINPVNDLALPPTNPGTSMSNYIIPKGTTVIQGSAAPNFGQLGGGAQFYVPNSMLKFLK